MSEVPLTRGGAIFPVCLVGTRTRSRRSCVPNDFDSEDAVKTAYHRHRLSLGVGLSKVGRRPGRPYERGHDPAGARRLRMAMREVGIRLAAGLGVAAAEEHFRTTEPNRWQLDRVA